MCAGVVTLMGGGGGDCMEKRQDNTPSGARTNGAEARESNGRDRKGGDKETTAAPATSSKFIEGGVSETARHQWDRGSDPSVWTGLE